MIHGGFSGATLTRLVRDDGARFVMKRMSIERDWIMRATEDVRCREVAFAQSAAQTLPRGVREPAIGAATDGSGFALLMRDISAELLRPGAVDDELVDRILRGIAWLHRAANVDANNGEAPWCDLARRLTLLTPSTAAIAAGYGAPVARDIIEGWRLFERLVPPRTSATLRALIVEPAPLLAALGRLPSALLHGDVKFDNIGVDAEGGLVLIDWAMVLRAPAAVDLGWFLAINSRRTTLSLDDVLERYATHADVPARDRGRHDALTVLCGLLLRGWRKALDADAGEPVELRWWCERADAATAYL